MYVCARFHEIPAKGLQDIKETKCYGRDRRTETRTDGQCENSIPTLKLRFAGGIIIDCGYTLEASLRHDNENPQSIFWSQNKKNRYTPAYPSIAK